MVAHTGFEPVVSSLRGTRPRPLDECAVGSTLSPERKFEVKSVYFENVPQNEYETENKNRPVRASIWLGIQDSNLGMQIQSLLSYH